MSRSFLANNNLIAVSAGLKETALNTAQTLDTSLLVAIANMIANEPRTEDNASEANGKEEADIIYNLGWLSSGTFDFEKCQAQHLALHTARARQAVGTDQGHTQPSGPRASGDHRRFSP